MTAVRRAWAAWIVAGLVMTVPVAWGVMAAHRAASKPRASLHVSGSLAAPLYPGSFQRLTLTLRNRRHFRLLVTRLVVRASVDAQHRALGCTRRDYAIRPIPKRAFPFRIAARSSMRLGALSPRMRMKNLPRNQDGCKGARLKLRYIGTVRRAK